MSSLDNETSSPSKPALAPVVLHELTQQLRDEPAPHVDYDRIERELFSRLDQSPVSTPNNTSRRVWWVVGLSAVAVAAASLFMVLSSPKSPTPSSPVAQSTTGASITNGSRELRFEEPGLAQWVLEPGAKLREIDRSAQHVEVNLESGAVVVDVIPGGAPDRFVVHAGAVRVSVKGTRFRVALVGDQVDVSVSRGVVGVTSDSDGTETKLPAPKSALFKKSTGQWLSYNAEVPELAHPLLPELLPHAEASTGEPALVQAPNEAAKPLAATPKHTNVAPSTALVSDENLRARFASAAADCFRREVHPSAGVNLTVTTSLVVNFDQDHKFTSLSLNPPLAPEVESCLRRRISSERGQGALAVSLRLVAGNLPTINESVRNAGRAAH